MKKLTSFSLEYDPENKDAVVCPVSKKIILHQPVVLIKPTGIVLLKHVFEELGGTTCPVTQKKLKSNDVLKLVYKPPSESASIHSS